MSAIHTIPGAIATDYSHESTGSVGSDPGASLLPLPAGAEALTGDITEQLALLVMKSAAASKSAHRAMEDAQEKSKAAEEDEQVAAMRREASDERSAGMLEGGLGGLSTAGACLGGALAGGVQSFGKLVDKAADVGLDVAKRYDSADIKVDQASAKQHEFAADKAKRSADRLKESVTDDQKTLDLAIQFVKELKAARDQGMLNITRRA